MRRMWRRPRVPESNGPVRNTPRAIRPGSRVWRAGREDGTRDRSAPHRPSPGRCSTQTVAHTAYRETASVSVDPGLDPAVARSSTRLCREVLDDLEICYRIRQSVPEPRADPYRTQRVKLFTGCARKRELALAAPQVDQSQIIGDGDGQLVDGRLVLLAFGEAGEIPDECRRPIEDGERIGNRLAQSHARVCQAAAVSG